MTSFAFRVMVDGFCLHLVQLLMCAVVVSFIWGCCLFFCTYLLFTPGCCHFSLGDPHQPTYTHPPTLQGFCADAHRFVLKCWWVVSGGGVGGTNQPTPHQTHPANHLPTNSHPSIHAHPATTQGFCTDVHRLIMEALPRLLLERNKK